MLRRQKRIAVTRCPTISSGRYDPGAFIAIEHVADVMGGRFRKKAIH